MECSRGFKVKTAFYCSVIFYGDHIFMVPISLLIFAEWGNGIAFKLCRFLDNHTVFVFEAMERRSLENNADKPGTSVVNDPLDRLLELHSCISGHSV